MQVIFYFTSFTSEDKLKIRNEFSYLAIPKVIVSFYGSVISKLNSQYYKILDFIYQQFQIILHFSLLNLHQF